MHAICAVVFDLDDTLYPELQFVQSGFRAVSAYLRTQGIIGNDIYPNLWGKFCDEVRGTVFNEVLCEEFGSADPTLVEQLVAVYRLHQPCISLYPDALPVLSFCSRHFKTGLLSDGLALTQQNKIMALRIRHFFNAVLLTDMLGREFWKPHRAGYENIASALGVAGTACVYVGDNPAKDFIGARACGWKTVRIQRSEGIYAATVAPPENDADYCIESLEELGALLGW